jgi:cytochrome c5
MNWLNRPLILMLALATCGLACGWALNAVAANVKQKDGKHVGTKAAQQDNTASAAAFGSIVPVLRHPRCMNCHSRGDFPRQGDDGHRHTMNVRRGIEGQGVAGLKCSTCHQDHNLVGEHMPPGAPDWHLPSASEPLIWEGLSDRQLCELFKDPARNGHRTVDGIVKHMNTPLVLWGWHPGEGRTPIPLPESEFLAKVREWASHGAACLGETSSSHPPGEIH